MDTNFRTPSGYRNDGLGLSVGELCGSPSQTWVSPNSATYRLFSGQLFGQVDPPQCIDVHEGHDAADTL